MTVPRPLNQLIETLKKLPGIGRKSAERFAYDLLTWSDAELENWTSHLVNSKNSLPLCQECGCLTDQGRCLYCTPERQANKTLCVIATPREVFLLEETGEYRGLYHVLGALLSPIKGIDADHLSVAPLLERIKRYGIEEVILALDSTLEGDTTSLYLKQELESLKLNVSRLAFGLPMGSSLDYIDGNTLARAFSGRSQF